MTDTPTTETVERSDTGFEFGERFYPWHVSDTGKDLLLIDRISGMAVDKFFELIEDDEQVLRGSVMLAMIATSLRAGNPTWSVERIVRNVMDLSISEDIEMIGGDDEEQAVPPAEGAPEAPTASDSPADVSSSSSTPQDS